jgi:serine/threonine-protein kinase
MVPLHARPLTEATHAMPSELFGYQVVDHLGDGAGSSIYAVSHPASGQLYALKHVVRRNDRDVRFLEQIENEYEVGRRVGHPNVRRVIDLHTQRRLFKTIEAALVMELVDGIPLDRRLPPHLPDLVTVFIRTAEALGALHRSGFVHCDFKPANILVGEDLSVKLIDLGQACPRGTAKQRIQGTPDFIAPEQVKCKPVDARTDVFNLGASMYWALCGRKMPTLFTVGRGENSLLCDTIIPSPATINPSVPVPISNLVMECVRIRAEKRPGDMDELAQRLEVMHHVAERAAATHA